MAYEGGTLLIIDRYRAHLFKNEKTGYDTKSLIKLRNILLYRFLFLTFAVSENEITHDEERNTIDC